MINPNFLKNFKIHLSKKWKIGSNFLIKKNKYIQIIGIDSFPSGGPISIRRIGDDGIELIVSLEPSDHDVHFVDFGVGQSVLFEVGPDVGHLVGGEVRFVERALFV